MEECLFCELTLVKSFYHEVNEGNEEKLFFMALHDLHGGFFEPECSVNCTCASSASASSVSSVPSVPSLSHGKGSHPSGPSSPWPTRLWTPAPSSRTGRPPASVFASSATARRAISSAFDVGSRVSLRVMVVKSS